MDKQIIACDLDGTLAEYDGWKGIHHIGKVVDSVKQAIRNVQAKGGQVWIFTARVSDPDDCVEASEHIATWLMDNGINVAGITSNKFKFFTEFWDDRALQVIKNTGAFVIEDDNQWKKADDLVQQAEPLFTPAEDVRGTDNQVAGALRDAANVFEERSQQYGNVYKEMHPDVFLALFPSGVALRTHDDFTRFALLNAIVGKLTRYSNNFNKGGHADSMLDLTNFTAMLSGVDNEISRSKF